MAKKTMATKHLNPYKQGQQVYKGASKGKQMATDAPINYAEDFKNGSKK